MNDKRLYPEYIITNTNRVLVYEPEKFNGVWSVGGVGFGDLFPRTYFGL